MVKKIATTLLCTVLGSSLNAGDNSLNTKGLIGFEVGAAKIQADTAFPIESNFKGSGDVEFGVRLGAQNESWRTMFIFDYYDSEDDNQNYEKGLFELDYFIFTTVSDEITFSPYIGINAGYMNYESDGFGINESIDESGFLYGGQIGFVFGLGESADLDLTYRYSLTDATQTDHMESFLVGINYIF